MNLQSLRVFLKVAELAHVTQAAEALHLTQPAVTKTVQSLEHELHLALVEHQGRRIVLTDAGRVVQTYARQFSELEQQMEEALALLRDVEVGDVHLAANTTVGTYLLPPIIGRFYKRHPRINLSMSILNSQDIIEHVLDWRLDVGFVEGDAAYLSSQLKIRFFARDHLVLVLSPHHPWRHMQTIKPQHLQKGVLIVREQGSGIRESIDKAFTPLVGPIQPLMTLTDNETIKQMVISGVGVAIVSLFSVQRELLRGDLVQLAIVDVDIHPQLSLIQRADKQLSQAARTFTQFLHPSPQDV
jgi:DNA-binding transcriptional LysR family regulator